MFKAAINPPAPLPPKKGLRTLQAMSYASQHIFLTHRITLSVSVFINLSIQPQQYNTVKEQTTVLFEPGPSRPQLFEGWIALSTQWANHYALDNSFGFAGVYPLESVLNYRGQIYSLVSTLQRGTCSYMRQDGGVDASLQRSAQFSLYTLNAILFLVLFKSLLLRTNNEDFGVVDVHLSKELATTRAPNYILKHRSLRSHNGSDRFQSRLKAS